MISMFPKGDGLCTRMPIRIRMRTGDPQDATLSIISIEKQGEEVIDSKELSGDIGAEIRETMDTLIAELHQAERGIRTDRLIQVELWAEDYPNLDLLDLPGIVLNAGPYDVETLPHDTYQLVIDTVEQTKGRAIYLAVREAGENVHNSMTIKVLRQCPEIKDHCLGVLTKCDRYADDLIIEELKASEEWALGYGYVATMNQPISDSHDLEALAETERSWFKKNEERVGLIERKQGGCDELSHKLSAVYHNYLRESWVPNTMRRLSVSILKKEHHLASLGEPVFEGKPRDEELEALNSAFQELLGHLQMKLTSEVQTLFRELPIWEGFSFPAGLIQYELDNNRNKRIRITQRSKLIKLMAHSTENLVSRFMQMLEDPLHAVFESQIQTIKQLLDEDQFAVKPITSARLGRFGTLSERLVELIKGSKFQVHILQRLKQETERYFVDHIDYRFDDDPNRDDAFINHLSQLRSSLITAMSMTTWHELCRLSMIQLDLNEEGLFQDDSKPVREVLDNELKLIERAQEDLIEQFDLERADSYASNTLLEFNDLWDKNGLVWHLGSEDGQMSRARAESAFKISTSSWETGNAWHVIWQRGYTECFSKEEMVVVSIGANKERIHIR
jgi:hypothetical protein